MVTDPKHGRIATLGQVDEATATVVLDTNAGQWVSPTAAHVQGGEELTRRCRHAVASVGPFVFIYGGLKGSQLLDDLLVADDSNGAELTIFDPRGQPWVQWMDAMHGNAAAAQMLAKAAMEEAEAALSVHRVGAMDDLRCVDEQIDNRLTDSPRSEQGSPDLTLNRGAAGAVGPRVVFVVQASPKHSQASHV